MAFHTVFGFERGWKEPKDFAVTDYLSLASTALGVPLVVFGFGCGVCWVLAGFGRSVGAAGGEQ
jgi:hypothetical protein